MPLPHAPVDRAAGAWGRARDGTGLRPAAAAGPSSGGASSSCATSISAFLASSTLLSFASFVILLPRGSAATRAAPGMLPLCIASGHLKLFRLEDYAQLAVRRGPRRARRDRRKASEASFSRTQTGTFAEANGPVGIRTRDPRLSSSGIDRHLRRPVLYPD